MGMYFWLTDSFEGRPHIRDHDLERYHSEMVEEPELGRMTSSLRDRQHHVLVRPNPADCHRNPCILPACRQRRHNHIELIKPDRAADQSTVAQPTITASSCFSANS
jgi:hypothetical protein